MAQLRAMSGQSVTFHTAVCLLDTASGRERTQEVPTVVKFRKLDEAEIQAYVDADQPYDCAGSAKIEGLGIALVEHVSSDDPTALIGLPLIALANLLRAEGIAVPNT